MWRHGREMMPLILVADTDTAVAEQVARALDFLAPETQHAGSVAAIKKAISGRQPDLIVLSNTLAGAGTFELVTSILECHPFVPVLLLLSDQRDQAEAVRILDLGITSFFVRSDGQQFAELLQSFTRHLLDRSERRRRQADMDCALRNSERKHKNLVKAAPICIHEIDLEGRLQSMNPAGLQMMGVEDEKLICGLNYLDVPIDEDKERIAKLMDDARLGFGSMFEFRVNAGGKILYFESSFQPVFDDEGTVVKLMGVTKDITERVNGEIHLRQAKAEAEQARQEAERANLAKTEFLAAMSHDLRTPLNAIVGFSETMMSELFGPIGDTRYRGYLDDIHQSGLLLTSLINDILDISKIEAGKYTLKREQVDLVQLTETCLRQVRQIAETAGIELVLKSDGTVPDASADRRAVIQIINNLLTNAIKFSSAGSVVSVHLRGAGKDMVEVRIRDEGAGMSPEEIEVALAPFERVESAHARDKEGTGLGLFLAANLTKLHGGTLKIESAHGSGTTVIFTLPRDVPAARSGGRPKKKASGQETDAPSRSKRRSTDLCADQPTIASAAQS